MREIIIVATTKNEEYNEEYAFEMRKTSLENNKKNKKNRFKFTNKIR